MIEKVFTMHFKCVNLHVYKFYIARSIFLVSMIEPDFNLQLSPKLLKWQYFKCEQIQSQALRPSHFIGRKGLSSR